MIKSEYYDSNDSERKYPYIGVGENHFVLFTAPNTGMVIKQRKTEGVNPIGYYSTQWHDEEKTSIMKGSITLSNE